MASNIIGLDRLLARLDNIAGDNAVMKGIQKGALRVESTAKQNITDNESVDTGLLRASIDHKLNISTLSATVGTNVEYGKFVEFGTSKQPAKPYLYNALASNTDNIKTDIIEAVRNEIRGG